MNFLGMGPGELMIIAVLGLIVFGPGKLPEIAGQIGKTIADFRRSTAEISSEFKESFSLEPAKPAPAPSGAAEVFAQNGAAASDPAEAVPVASAEPALADTSQWHWESSPAQETALAAEAAPAASSFWEWDAPPTETAAAPTTATVAGPLTTTTWEWDEPEQAPPEPAELTAMAEAESPPVPSTDQPAAPSAGPLTPTEESASAPAAADAEATLTDNAPVAANAHVSQDSATVVLSADDLRAPVAEGEPKRAPREAQG